MKQIVNSYMVNRYIQNMKPGIPSDSVFYKNLLKLAIILEQWPRYQIDWMLVLLVENLQQELKLRIEHVLVNKLVVCQLKLVKASRLSLQRY